MRTTKLARHLAVLMICTLALVTTSCDSQDNDRPDRDEHRPGRDRRHPGTGARPEQPGAADLTDLTFRSGHYYTGQLNPATVCKPKSQGGDGVPAHSTLGLNSGNAQWKASNTLSKTNIRVTVNYTGDLRLRGYCIQLTGIDLDQTPAWGSRWSFHSTSSRTRTFQIQEMSKWQHAVSGRAVVSHSYGGNTYLFRTKSVSGNLHGRTYGDDQDVTLTP